MAALRTGDLAVTWLAILNLLRGLVKAIPPRVWLLLAFLAAVAFAVWYQGHRERVAYAKGWRAGGDVVQARWDEANREAIAAQLERDRKALRINSQAASQGAAVSTETRSETAQAVEKVRYVTRTITVPAGCPTGLPAGVVQEGRAAVLRARAAGD